MSIANLGNTLVIANPASHSGRGKACAEKVARFFDWCSSATTSFKLVQTTGPGDAEYLAGDSLGYDTVIALGGDGVIHEVVNGLMEISGYRRPRLGLVAVGSGNDFARTLGLPQNDTDASIHQLLTGKERIMDLGYVTADGSRFGTYFTETLSFGIDAAIALDTTTRRQAGDSQHGSKLYLTSGLKLFSKVREPYRCTMSIDGGGQIQLNSLILTVQNGPTYGGGFTICPQAAFDDGVLDVCYNVRQPCLPHVLLLFALARFGKHVSSSVVRLTQARTLELSFEDSEQVPCQIDGEELLGKSFSIKIVPSALRVIAL